MTQQTNRKQFISVAHKIQKSWSKEYRYIPKKNLKFEDQEMSEEDTK